MGNCLGIFWNNGRPGFAFFWENGISTSTQGLHSSLSSSPNQPPCEGRQASTSRPSKELRSEERSDMISKLEIVLENIDSALYSHRYQNLTPSNREDGIPDFLDKKCKDAEKALEKILKKKTEVEVMDIAPEAWNLLQSGLGEIASFHWVTIAFSVVTSVLTRVEDMGKNKRDCLSVLENLHRLGNRLVKLFHDKVILTEEDCRKPAQVIVEGAVLCIAHLNSTPKSRFVKVNATKGSIEKLEGKIQSLYPDLILLATQRAMVKPMKSYNAKFPEHAVGLNQTVCKIMRIMKAATQEAGKEKTPAILLHGIGGIGKTTLGEALCARIPMDCAYTVAKIELGLKPSSRHISECQSDILEIFCEERQKIENPSKGQVLLGDNLEKCSSPILLFIDNVFEGKDLNKFLPRTLSLPQNSYILVTSRHEGVSEGLHGCVLWKTYEVGGLQTPEAETFLETLLVEFPSDKKEKFNTVIGLCDGWPLALETIGSYLRSQKLQDNSVAWDSVITRLRKCGGVDGRRNNEMIEVLKWTYEQMDRECQNVFLDICFLSRNADWDWVKTLGHTRFEWNTLKSLSLVKKKEVEYGFRRSQYDFFRHAHDLGDTWCSSRAAVHVHDLFVALGEQESQERPGVRFHIRRGDSLPPILQAQHNEDACELVEVLVLNEIDMRLSAEKLDAMHKRLRILHLGTNVHVDGVCRTIPSNLRICSMFGFPYRDLSGLQDLRVLHIEGGYGGHTLHLQFEQLKLPKRLEILHLSGIDGLSHFDVEAFKGCDDLHTVRIKMCQNLRELPASICFCPKIRGLFLQMNSNLSSLPQDLNQLQSLERFYFDGQKLGELPTGFAGLKKLQEVFVAKINRMPEDLDFSQMPLLESIHLDYDLSQPPPQVHRHHGFGKLLSLRALRIGDCEMNQVLIDEISQLKALKELDLEGCKSLQRLPDALSQLSSLEYLNLAKCTSLTELPRDFGSLHALKFLTLRGCKNLQLLPDSFSGLETLQTLELRGCETLKELPRGFEKLHLIIIDLAECYSLQKLPKNFGDLAMLEEVNLYDCRSLKLLPENLGDLEKLTSLYISENLEALPEFVRRLKHLRFLSLYGCRSLKMLPESWGNLEELTGLDLSYCTNLEALPESMTRLKRLAVLYLKGCRREVQCSQVLAELSVKYVQRDEEYIK